MCLSRGIFSPSKQDTLGKEAYVFHGLRANGEPGMDEISNLGPTVFCRLKRNGNLERFTVEPEEVSLERGKPEELAPAGSPQEEAVGLVRLLSGKENGARLDAVCINTAPMFPLARRVKDFKTGVELAKELIFAGKGLAKLKQWVSCQNREPQMGLARFERVLREAGVTLN